MPLISVGDSIQAAVNANPPGTSFCLESGLHEFGSGKPNTTSITPKSGNIFTGQFGATLDGTAWSSSDTTAAAFRSHLNGTIDDVSIRNLVIRNMPQRAIHAWHQNSAGWIVEYNHIHDCRCGVSPGVNFIIRHNKILTCNGDSVGGTIPNGGYIGTNCSGTRFEANEIAYCGAVQKIIGDTNTGQATDVVFDGNWFHDNEGSAIWYDGDSLRGIVENNTIEDNAASGVMYEISAFATIRNNVIKRSGDCGIFISNSRDNDIYSNALEDNYRGIILLANLTNTWAADAPYAGAIGWDLRNNSVHDNDIILVPANVAAFPISNGTNYVNSGVLTPYTSNLKQNNFDRNHYHHPSGDALLYFWGAFKTFAQWQALGYDVGGDLS